MAKKLQLNELKIKSFVTTLNTAEQKTAKGGYIYDSGAHFQLYNPRGGSFTVHKTQGNAEAINMGDILTE